MRRRLAAFGVHVLTASGAVLSFLALMEVIAHRWEAAFAWLGLALLVDGVDGPLARWVGATEALPRFSGEHLDIVIDYLTYVFVPAFIVYEAKLVPSDLALTAVAIILLTSLFHFTDQRSKAADGFFIGFPALWNIVAFYFVIFQIPPGTSFILLVLFAVLTFSR